MSTIIGAVRRLTDARGALHRADVIATFEDDPPERWGHHARVLRPGEVARVEGIAVVVADSADGAAELRGTCPDPFTVYVVPDGVDVSHGPDDVVCRVSDARPMWRVERPRRGRLRLSGVASRERPMPATAELITRDVVGTWLAGRTAAEVQRDIDSAGFGVRPVRDDEDATGAVEVRSQRYRAVGPDTRAEDVDRIVQGIASSTSEDWYGTEMTRGALDDMAEQFRSGVVRELDVALESEVAGKDRVTVKRAIRRRRRAVEE